MVPFNSVEGHPDIKVALTVTEGAPILSHLLFTPTPTAANPVQRAEALDKPSVPKRLKVGTKQVPPEDHRRWIGAMLLKKKAVGSLVAAKRSISPERSVTTEP